MSNVGQYRHTLTTKEMVCIAIYTNFKYSLKHAFTVKKTWWSALMAAFSAAPVRGRQSASSVYVLLRTLHLSLSHQPDIPRTPPLHMPTSSQSRLSHVVSKPSYQRCPSNILISNNVHPRHSQRKPQHLQLCHSWSHYLLVNFPLHACRSLPSQITPVSLLHPLHPVCTLLYFGKYFDPKYLNSSTFTISTPCTLTTPPHSLSFIPSCTYSRSFPFSPMHTSTSPGSSQPVPYSHYRSQCHPQTP